MNFFVEALLLALEALKHRRKKEPRIKRSGKTVVSRNLTTR